uniref:Reverse transcriptase domain-containing protein n=1 Tax=Amphiprion percula TaxID=161767 RepID=A0A3P8SI42_AMPPE
LSSDSGQVTILILHDLSAAFDTINHSILLSRESANHYATVQPRFTSYLTNRQQFIKVKNCTSPTAPLSHGVPQGSVLGPLLFILYLLPLGNIIRRHNLHFHCYANDIQLYISTNTTATTTLPSLSTCLADIKSWMRKNFLLLNCDKTNLIFIGPKSLTPFPHSPITIDNTTLSPSAHIRNLVYKKRKRRNCLLLWNRFLWTENSTSMKKMEGESVEEEGTFHDPKHHPVSQT